MQILCIVIDAVESDMALKRSLSGHLAPSAHDHTTPQNQL